jgi:predicted ArsR family transcriptional regulator
VLERSFGQRSRKGVSYTLEIEDVPDADTKDEPTAADLVVEALRELGPSTVIAISDAMELPQSTVRGCLTQLGRSGSVETTGKEGRANIYALVDSTVDDETPEGVNKSTVTADDELDEYIHFAQDV